MVNYDDINEIFKNVNLLYVFAYRHFLKISSLF